MSFVDYLSNGFGRLSDLLPLALVPFFAAFLHIDDIRKTLQFTGYHLGVRLQFPTGLPTFWTFASVPNSTAPGVHISPTLYFAPIYIVVTSILVAGFVGSIGEFTETGRYEFNANARNYFLPFLGYTVLRWAIIILPVAGKRFSRTATGRATTNRTVIDRSVRLLTVPPRFSDFITIDVEAVSMHIVNDNPSYRMELLSSPAGLITRG